MDRFYLYLLLFLLVSTECLSQGGLAKFEPPDGFVYHGVGQYPQGVDEYDDAMEDSTRPLLVKLYFDIPGTRPGRYTGLREALAKEKGIGRFPEVSIAFTDGIIGTDSIIANTTRYDATIDSIAAICREYGTRLFVRPGFEFNGAWNGYHPYHYVKAFRKIVDRFRTAGAADSVAFVWCYYAGGAPNDFDSVDVQGARWYPGDEYVDWFGLDLFFAEDFDMSLPELDLSGRITTRGKSERFLAMARAKGKPVLLSETSAAGTDITADPIDGLDDWDAWFAPFFEFMDAHDEIKGFCYINWDWRAYDLYADWGNARIDSNLTILDMYIEEMRLPWYIHLPTGSTPPVLDAPTLISPANGSTGQPAPVTLTWQGSDGAQYHHLQLATASDLASPIVNDSTIPWTSFSTGALAPGTRYYWRVRSGAQGGTSPWSETWSFTTAAVTGVDRIVAGGRAPRVAPNPFNGGTTIYFSLTHREHVRLAIHDAMGNEIRRLVDGVLEAGDHAMRLEGSDLPAGIYLYSLTTTDEAMRGTIHLVR